MWEWRLGVQPRELAVPRRQVDAVGLLLGALVAGAVRLLAGTWGPAVIAGCAVAGPVFGYASWRWTGWVRGGHGRILAWFPPVFAVVTALWALGDRREEPFQAAVWAGLCIVYLSLVPAGFHGLRTHPPRQGWFPDPTGRFAWRWWADVRWTDAVGGPDGGSEVDPDGAPETTLANAPRRSDPLLAEATSEPG